LLLAASRVTCEKQIRLRPSVEGYGTLGIVPGYHDESLIHDSPDKANVVWRVRSTYLSVYGEMRGGSIR
jgi:hypothetical protein